MVSKLIRLLGIMLSLVQVASAQEFAIPLRNESDTQEFEIIAINVDEDTEDALKFLRDHPVGYPVIADPQGEIGIPYGIRSLPRSFLLDREGRIVSSHKSFKPGDEISLKQEVIDLLKK